MPRQISKADWSKSDNVSFDSQGNRLLGAGHLTTEGTKGKSRSDWSGTQFQLWSNPQFPPQKTKFNGNWYFEDELIFSYPADKWNYNIWMDKFTGGKILMTKQQAYEMGMTPQQVINWYNEDKLFYDSAKKTNTKPSLFFEYRKDGSITGKFKPPIIPPPTPATPPPVMTLPEPAPVVEPAPEPVPVGNLNPYQLKTTIDPKWILLAIVGVGILSAMIFIMRGRK